MPIDRQIPGCPPFTLNGASLYPRTGTLHESPPGPRYYLIHAKAGLEIMGKRPPGYFYRHLAGLRYYRKRLRPKAKRGSRKYRHAPKPVQFT